MADNIVGRKSRAEMCVRVCSQEGENNVILHSKMSLLSDVSRTSRNCSANYMGM